MTLRTTPSLYNNLERRTQGNLILLTVLSISVLPGLTFAFCFNAPIYDRMGWQRISALWNHDWIDLDMD
ncbi:hypothetical protein [Absidia glauca]|uniref:Uncharacterized protein n=1 Tax=Absidia glauca TaxID=4829 RepID=A0A163LVX5_ABSGL|nr:hypothetical protein [Absidia glauca]